MLAAIRRRLILLTISSIERDNTGAGPSCPVRRGCTSPASPFVPSIRSDIRGLWQLDVILPAHRNKQHTGVSFMKTGIWAGAAALALLRSGFETLPVVDENGHVVGLFDPMATWGRFHS